MAYNRYRLNEVLNLHPDFIVSFYEDDTVAIHSFKKQLDTLGLANRFTFQEIYLNKKAKMVVSEFKTIRDITE